jgi:SAM-dependent methyltransferase
MGIDVHTLKFLKYVNTKKAFGDTLTIGRQGIHVIEPAIKKIIRTNVDYKNKEYCEELFIKYFGAKKVESIDNNLYEKATHNHDMNEMIQQNIIGKFDTVFDGGCLEHIFNVPQALKNCSHFCKQGGQIIHVLPANNFCGHGFWQFSPELFFSLYSKENGYIETEVFIADLSDTKKWYQVKQLGKGERAEIMSQNSLYVLVRTVINNEFRHSNIQQSDYIYTWNNVNNKSNNKEKLTLNKDSIKETIKKIPFIYDFLYPIYTLYRQLKKNNKLNKKNPALSVLQLKNFID